MAAGHILELSKKTHRETSAESLALSSLEGRRSSKAKAESNRYIRLLSFSLHAIHVHASAAATLLPPTPKFDLPLPRVFRAIKIIIGFFKITISKLYVNYYFFTPLPKLWEFLLRAFRMIHLDDDVTVLNLMNP